MFCFLFYICRHQLSYKCCRIWEMVLCMKLIADLELYLQERWTRRNVLKSLKKNHNKQNFEVKYETSIKLTTKKFLFCKLNHYRKLFLRVRRLPALHSCIRWSHSGIGTFQLLYSFALMLVCYSLSYGQHRPILLWTMDRISRSPHYWRLLDSICLHLYTTLGNNKTICMRFIFESVQKKDNKNWRL